MENSKLRIMNKIEPGNWSRKPETRNQKPSNQKLETCNSNRKYL